MPNLDLFADAYAPNVPAKLGTAVSTTPAAGTVESWTVVITSPAIGAAPAAILAGQQYRAIVDPDGAQGSPEIVLVTAGTMGAGTQTWTVTRGQEGTISQTHGIGALIQFVPTAGSIGTMLQQGTVYDARALGLVFDGVTDNTATLNSIIATYCAANAMILCPAGTCLVKGQIVGPTSGSIIFQGMGNGYTVGSIAPVGGTIFDFRWDGGVTSTAKNAFANEYAVVQGLAVSGLGTGTITVAAGYGLFNAAIGASPTSCAGGTASATRADGTYYVDIQSDNTIVVTATGSGWSWTGAEATKKIRLAQITIASNVITAIQDMRSFPGRIDGRQYGALSFRDVCVRCNATDSNNAKNDIPFTRASQMYIDFQRVNWVGQRKGTLGIACLEDAVVFGGTGGPASTLALAFGYAASAATAYGTYNAYGAHLTDCIGGQIKRLAVLRAAANAIVIKGCQLYNSCSNPSGGAIEFEVNDTGYNNISGCNISGSWIESPYYSYGVRMKTQATQNTITGLTMIDSVIYTIVGSVTSSQTTLTILHSNTIDQNVVALLGKPLLIGWDPHQPWASEVVTVNAGTPVQGSTVLSGTVSGSAGGSTLTFSGSQTFTTGQVVLLGNNAATQEIVTINTGATGTSFAVTSYATVDGTLKNTYASVAVAIEGAGWILGITRATNGNNLAHTAGQQVFGTIAAVRYDYRSNGDVSYNTVLGGGGAGLLVSDGQLDNGVTSYNTAIPGGQFLPTAGIVGNAQGLQINAPGIHNINFHYNDGSASQTVAFWDGTTTEVLEIGGSTGGVGGLAIQSGFKLYVGGGTGLSQITVYTPTLTPAAVAGNTSAEQTFTVNGLTTADKVIVNAPLLTTGTGIVNARVSASNTLALMFANHTAGSLTPTSGTYTIIAIRS